MYLANGIVCVSLNLSFFNRGQLLYNVVLVSAIQQCVSVITVYICIFPLEPCSHPQPCLCPFSIVPQPFWHQGWVSWKTIFSRASVTGMVSR